MKRIALGLGVFLTAVALPLCLTRAEEALPKPVPQPYGGNSKDSPDKLARPTSVSTPDNSIQAAQPAVERARMSGCHARLTPQPASTLVPTPVSPVVVDLVTAMSETRSKGAFVAAVLALAELGPDARPAIPAILRHGERLGVYDDAFDGDGNNRKGAAGRLVTQALAAIASGIGPGPDAAAVHPPYGYAAYPYSYGSPGPMESCSPPPPVRPAQETAPTPPRTNTP